MLASRTMTAGRAALLLASLAVGTFPGSALGQLIPTDTSVGYIDPAIPLNQLRLRYDAAYGGEFPDRAEFFYGTWAAAVPGAPGPPLRERQVDFQEGTAYLEFAPREHVSVFVEAPVRMLNPEINDNTAGLGDMTAGLKCVLAQGPCGLVSMQLKTYVPTGDADRGLGTDHASLEPGLLLFRRLSQRWILEGELRDWIPVDGTDGFAGNVLRYGMGVSCLAHQSCSWSFRPVIETVGWTVLDGRKTHPDGIFDADGDTIVNIKAGMRMNFVPLQAAPTRSIYVGYGRALTDEVWYTDIARLELRFCY